MGILCTWGEDQHVQTSADISQRLEAPFWVILAHILNDVRARPLELPRRLERNIALTDVALVFVRVVGDAQVFIVYTYIRKCKGTSGKSAVCGSTFSSGDGDPTPYSSTTFGFQTRRPTRGSRLDFSICRGPALNLGRGARNLHRTALALTIRPLNHSASSATNGLRIRWVRRSSGEGSAPTAWIVGRQLLPLAQQARQHTPLRADTRRSPSR